MAKINGALGLGYSFALVVLLAMAGGPRLAFARPLELASPDGGIRLRVRTEGRPRYEIRYQGRRLISRGELNLRFLKGGAPRRLRVVNVNRRTEDSVYPLPVGKLSRARNHFHEMTLDLREEDRPHRRLRVEFRAFDDAIAFRYVLPRQPVMREFVIGEELSAFTPSSPAARISALPLNFNSPYEAYYQTATLDQLTPHQTLGLPLLISYPTGEWVGFTEASLTDYAGLYLAPNSDDRGRVRLEARLAPKIGRPEIKVEGATPFASPWRVFLISNRVGAWLESPALYNLNEPQAFSDTSWIRLGKVHFPWWNHYYMPGDREGKSGLNTWTLLRYVDFCASQGIAFHSLDGLETAWYGGPIAPYEGADVTKPAPGLDLESILVRAKALGVGTRAWLHWQGVAFGNLERVLSAYENMGLSGIMLDFLERDDQEMVRFYADVVRAAARHHLTVNFHGVFKPTGLGRTYPNLISHEAVLGTEFNKWGVGSTPDHELMVSFVRMMAGPLDTHQGSFRPVAPQDFKPGDPPQAMGTLARQLGLYVVYENHLPMVADYPEAYLAQSEAFRFVREVPETWDETRVIAAEFGRFLVIARRRGADWYVGGITGTNSQQVELPLDFLGGKGAYEARIYRDSSTGGTIEIETRPVSSDAHLTLEMANAGGFALRIHPTVMSSATRNNP